MAPRRRKVLSAVKTRVQRAVVPVAGFVNVARLGQIAHGSRSPPPAPECRRATRDDIHGFRMQIEIITIGNEILSGRTLDTNFSFLARALEEVSVAVGWHTTVGDTAERIGEALRIAVGRADAS